MGTDYSRGLRLAGAAAEADVLTLRETLSSTRVHLTANPEIPGVLKALPVLVADLRRLPYQLSLDPLGGTTPVPDEVLAGLQSLVDGIDPDLPLRLSPAPAGCLHIHLGTQPPSGAALSGVSDGHGVRIRHAGHPFPRLTAPGSGLGAVLTAASLTAEVFKLTVGLRTGTYATTPVVDFCPVTLGTEPGAMISSVPEITNTALVGAGAIGTGIILILELLGMTGQLTVVEPEPFEPPNVTTYSIGTLDDAAALIHKTGLARRHLPHMDVNAFPYTAQDFINAIDNGTERWPSTVLGAVHSIEARHEIQRIHADLTLDGSTGGGAGTTLALHEALPHGPCMRCYYPLPPTPTALSAEQRLHALTGLPLHRIARGDAPLAPADLEGLSIEQQSALSPYLGAPVCGLSNVMGLTDNAADDFQPSAAFVAQQAACLVVGAMIARSTGLVAGPMRHVEYDARFGPWYDMTTLRRPRSGCACQSEADVIAAVRTQRRRPL
ncbi:ThiF family adenylyltransferase [Streptomyces hokutonensis]|uniref:ThiF family adenylyltransferase n=1 Tax=Streptomyces hokutonensis TaxID=1306990 RepID=UPI00381C6596